VIPAFVAGLIKGTADDALYGFVHAGNSSAVRCDRLPAAVIVWFEPATKVGSAAVTGVVAAMYCLRDSPPGQSSYHEHT